MGEVKGMSIGMSYAAYWFNDKIMLWMTEQDRDRLPDRFRYGQGV